MSFLYIYLISFGITILGAKYEKDDTLVPWAFVPVCNIVTAGVTIFCVVGMELCKWVKK